MQSAHKQSQDYLVTQNIENIDDQVITLRRWFTHLGVANFRSVTWDLPLYAEGWFAVPQWQLLAPSYAEATQVIFNALKRSCGVKIQSMVGEFNPAFLRKSEETSQVFKEIADQQQNADILLFPAQLIAHQESKPFPEVRRFHPNEAKLGLYEFLVMLLVNPITPILNGYCIVLSGDECDHGQKGAFTYVLQATVIDSLIRIGMCPRHLSEGGTHYTPPATFFKV